MVTVRSERTASSPNPVPRTGSNTTTGLWRRGCRCPALPRRQPWRTMTSWWTASWAPALPGLPLHGQRHPHGGAVHQRLAGDQMGDGIGVALPHGGDGDNRLLHFFDPSLSFCALPPGHRLCRDAPGFVSKGHPGGFRWANSRVMSSRRRDTKFCRFSSESIVSPCFFLY